MSLSIGTAQRALPGQLVCGDSILLLRHERATVVLADGLGHGPEAARAATALCAYVEAHADDAIEDLFHGASAAIANTRGAAGAVLRIDVSTLIMEFAGVGNVELQAVTREAVRPFSVPGIIGQRLRKVLRFEYPLAPGDMLALYSDGISSRFELERYTDQSAEEAAAAILADHGKAHDDATCVVIRV